MRRGLDRVSWRTVAVVFLAGLEFSQDGSGPAPARAMAHNYGWA